MKRVKKVSWGLICAAIASVLATLMLSIFLFWKLFFEGAEQTLTVKIPNFVGERAELINTEGFETETSYVYTEDGHGIIISQSPYPDALRKCAVGEKIKIKLSISAPEPKITLPDLSGFDGREAAIMLRNLGFEVKTVTLRADSAEFGSVLSSTPMPRSRLFAGETVTLYVASAPREYCAKVPELLGSAFDEAQRQIEENGFVLGNITFDDADDRLRGKICSQGLKSGILAPIGSVIDICIGRCENFYEDNFEEFDEFEEFEDFEFKKFGFDFEE